MSSAAPPQAGSEPIIVGRVVKPHGLRGEVVVECLSDRADRFPALRSVLLSAADHTWRASTVSSSRPHKGRFIIRLEGVDGIDAAEALRGSHVGIGPEQIEPLPPGSYYHHELIGLEVLDTKGERVGRSEAVWTTGAGADVLVVRGGPRGEILLPLLGRFVPEVDLESRRIRVEIPATVTVDARG